MRVGINFGGIFFIIEPNVKTALFFETFVDCFKNLTIFTDELTNLGYWQGIGNDSIMASDGWRKVDVEVCGFEHVVCVLFV